MKANAFYVIVGLGITGLSCARYLQARGFAFGAMDTRENPPQLDLFKSLYPDAPLALGGLDDALLSQATHIVLSPGIALNQPYLQKYAKRGIPLIGDIELFAQAVQAPVIAITGTNAKSTVTTLVGLMAKASGHHVQVGGNLGEPALDLLQADPDTTLFVLELSSFQLETTYSLHPAVACILNISPDHMDRYASLADYQGAKQRVYEHCAVAVSNREDALTFPTHAHHKTHYAFTLQTPHKQEFGLIRQNEEVFLAFESTPLLSTRALPLKGRHDQANALAALALGYGMGFSMEAMLSVLCEFRGLPHRCQWVRERRGVKWYNDSKGTNVGATQAALEGLGKEASGKIILIAGGVGKNADFSPLLPAIQAYTRHVVLIGEAAQTLAALIQDVVPVSFAHSMQEAVAQADAVAKGEDSVLLSPACASFDMFKHYEHRGQVFMEVVTKLNE